ncbi:MAG: hypothetical protein ACK6D2_15195 [Planctomycetota bacterium]
MRTIRPGAFAALLLPAAAIAQILPTAVPYARTQDLFVADSTNDACYRLTDFNQDGDYNDPGEANLFYSDFVGAFPWTNPAAVGCAADGTVYVADTTTDVGYALRDLTGDGDANDPSEATVFLDNANASGFVMQTVNGITFDVLGRIYLTNANTSTPVGPDRSVRVQDQNGDGDANDAGEVFDFYTVPSSVTPVGVSIPTKAMIGPDLCVYYTEIGTGTAYPKGVYRLNDLNQDGDCNDAGEAAMYWTPPFAASPFYWGFAIDQQGWFYVTDHSTNEKVWRGKDLNGNGTIETTEQTLYYQTSASTWWEVAVRDDGVVFLCESQSPDRVTRLVDLNGDGDALDAGESFQAYDSSVSTTAVGMRGLAFQRAPLLQAQPPVAPIGTTTNLVTQAAAPGDLVLLVMSIGLGPAIALPPFGVVEIDVSSFASLGVGLADPQGYFGLPLSIPNNPAVIGAYAFQSLAGNQFRLFLANAASLTVTP